MVGRLFIIIPHGGTAIDFSRTIKSCVSHPNSRRFIILAIANNGASFHSEKEPISDQVCRLETFDINPISCRSTARNFGLSYVEKELDKNDYVLFLDAGDELTNSWCMKDINTEVSISVGRPLICAGNITYSRIRWPIWLINYVNPVYLGSALIRADVAIRYRFPAQKKEDWAFWRAAYTNGEKFHEIDKYVYYYHVKSRSNHLMRKIGLINDQYLFFRKNLALPILPAITYLIFHYLLSILAWSLLKRKKSRS